MKKIVILVVFLLALNSFAQQDPQYTQYMYNMNVVNPAYAGSSDNFAIGLLYRSQWVGIDGAPKTFTANAHSPVGKQVGLGLSIIADEIGPVKETNAYADFSYTLQLGANNRLALGVKAGATFHDIGLTDLEVLQPGDPFLQENINEVTPNIGAGAYLYKPNRYYVSVSMPNVLESVHLDANGYKIGSETRHLFAAAGYVFSLSENFKLKPHALLKTSFNAPLSFDINANLFMYDVVEFGLGYRLEDSFIGMVNFQVAPGFRIGYAYDRIQSQINIGSNSSHEIFLNIDLDFPKKVSRSPRYF